MKQDKDIEEYFDITEVIFRMKMILFHYTESQNKEWV